MRSTASFNDRCYSLSLSLDPIFFVNTYIHIELCKYTYLIPLLNLPLDVVTRRTKMSSFFPLSKKNDGPIFLSLSLDAYLNKPLFFVRFASVTSSIRSDGVTVCVLVFLLSS